MKEIYLRSITLTNWRGEKHRKTVFATGGETSICGMNGLGKSRHFDAFCWLLFGKDSKDRKDFELRTRTATGQLLRKVECSVEAELVVDGELITLKREQKEKWVKPKGDTTETFKGNETECTWNGTPVRVGEYQDRVSREIIDDTLFKMITNPDYFLRQMPWKQQRETLLEMAGTIPAADLAGRDERFAKLMDEIGGRSLDDYRKMIAAEKKRLKAKMQEIQPRIDQTHRMMPEVENWKSLEETFATNASKINVLRKQTDNATAYRRAQAEEAEKIRFAIDEQERKQRAAVRAEESRIKEERYAAGASIREVEMQLRDAHSAISQAEITKKQQTQLINATRIEIEQTNKRLDDLRKQWRTINAQEWNGETTCPHCHQQLPQAMIADAQRIWREEKQQRLADNVRSGKGFADFFNTLNERLAQAENDLQQAKQLIQTKEQEVVALNEKLSNLRNEQPKEQPVCVDGATLPLWQVAATEIKRLQERLKNLDMGDGDSSRVSLMESNIKALEEENTNITSRLAKREQIAKAQQEIARLEDEGRDLAQQIADIEKREDTATALMRAKIEDCERRINSLFDDVRFRLFDQTQDGNVYETCIALVGGIPYDVLNTAARINAGLDIVNSLCRWREVTAPIFIDNAESVNRLRNTTSQKVLLCVTEDTELKVITDNIINQ